MIESDKKVFRVIMVGAGEVYGKEITKPLLQIYYNALKDYSIEYINAAFSEHLADTKHGTFFPKPADILSYLRLSSSHKAESAWLTIVIEIQASGNFKYLQLDDDVALMSLQSIGGWRFICMSNEDQLPWLKKNFIEAYERLQVVTENKLLSESNIHFLENKKEEKNNDVSNM